MLSGVRPIIRLASWPTARISPVVAFSATTRRLVEQDALAAHVDERVGGAEVNGHVAADEAVRHACVPARRGLARVVRGDGAPGHRPRVTSARSDTRVTAPARTRAAVTRVGVPSGPRPAADHVLAGTSTTSTSAPVTGSPAASAQRHHPGPDPARLDVDVLVERVPGAALDRRLVQREREHRRGGELLAGRPAQRRRTGPGVTWSTSRSRACDRSAASVDHAGPADHHGGAVVHRVVEARTGPARSRRARSS